MYQNFEGLERGEDIKVFKFFWVFPNPLGVLNQKNLFPTLIYQFEHLLQWSETPYSAATGSKFLPLATDFSFVSKT